MLRTPRSSGNPSWSWGGGRRGAREDGYRGSACLNDRSSPVAFPALSRCSVTLFYDCTWKRAQEERCRERGKVHVDPFQMRQLTLLKSSFIFRQAYIHQLFVEHLVCAKLIRSGGQQWNKSNFWLCRVDTLACMARDHGTTLYSTRWLALLLLLLMVVFFFFK